ncbi:MAG: sodium:calcium antiporter [Chloroflexota bacterium]|nr:sodium:calcium antiporter [Chloroflexota bacterium]
MTLFLSLVLLAVSFVVILAGAELFTNGIEWLGQKMGLSEGMVGSVLAAVGTAMPETMIPIIAIIFVGTAESEEIGIGAILGAPFLLSTAAMFVTGVAVLAYHRSGRRKNVLNINQVIVRRDLRFFLGMYIVAITLGLPFFEKPFWLRVVAGILLVGAYVLYVRQTASDPKSESTEALAPLHFQRKLNTPRTRAVALQVVVALSAIIFGANLFVQQIEGIAHLFAIPPLVLSLIVAPLATELPEKFNSVIWIRQRKDTLAMGNISGAMVFQSCIPVAVGLWFTPWVLNEFAIVSAVIAIAAGILMQLYLRSDNTISGAELTSLGILYAVFLIYVFAFPHSGLAPAALRPF